MINKIIVIVFVLLISACSAKKQYVYVDRVVNVPTIVFKSPPKPARVVKPILYINTLDLNSTSDQFLNSCIISLEQSIKYSNKLEIAIEPYRKGN